MNNYIDWFIIGIILLSVIVSLFRGFIREVFSLVSWVAAFFVAANFYEEIATYLTQIQTPYLRNGVAMGILFLATLIIGGLISYALGKLVDKTGLTGTDRVLGGCFGLLRGVLIVSALLFFVDAFTSIHNTEMWKNSQLIPHFRFIIDWFFEQMKANSSLLNDLPQQAVKSVKSAF